MRKMNFLGDLRSFIEWIVKELTPKEAIKDVGYPYNIIGSQERSNPTSKFTNESSLLQIKNSKNNKFEMQKSLLTESYSEISEDDNPDDDCKTLKMFGQDTESISSPPNSQIKKQKILTNFRKKSSPLLSSSISPELEARVRAASGSWRYSVDNKNKNSRFTSINLKSEFPILLNKNRSEKVVNRARENFKNKNNKSCFSQVFLEHFTPKLTSRSGNQKFSVFSSDFNSPIYSPGILSPTNADRKARKKFVTHTELQSYAEFVQGQVLIEYYLVAKDFYQKAHPLIWETLCTIVIELEATLQEAIELGENEVANLRAAMKEGIPEFLQILDHFFVTGELNLSEERSITLTTVLISEDFDYCPLTYDIFTPEETYNLVNGYFLGYMLSIKDGDLTITGKQYDMLVDMLDKLDVRAVALIELWMRQLMSLDEIIDTLFVLESCHFSSEKAYDKKEQDTSVINNSHWNALNSIKKILPLEYSEICFNVKKIFFLNLTYRSF